MRLLDLFCGAGGAAMGYHRAGFDEIVGVDIVPQPNYPFTFIRGDALQAPVRLEDFDLIHASPPCQGYSITRRSQPGKAYPLLIEPVRAMLQASGRPYVIENVERAPLIDPIVLCGTEFGLSAFDPGKGRIMHLKRHRLFELSWFAMSAGGCSCTAHRGSIAGVYGGGGEDRKLAPRNGGRGGYTPKAAVRRVLMDIDWTTSAELSEAIPPAYTEHLGRQFFAHLGIQGSQVSSVGVVLNSGTQHPTNEAEFGDSEGHNGSFRLTAIDSTKPAFSVKGAA